MERRDHSTVDTHQILACLGVPARFKLVRTLATVELCVTELATEIGLSQSCTTRHLQVLGKLGLVEGRREGKRVRFRLREADDSVGTLISWLLSGSVPKDRDGSAPRDRAATARGARAGRPVKTQVGDGGEEPQALDAMPERPGHPRSKPGDLEDFLL